MSGLRAALAAALWPDDGGGGGEGERRGERVGGFMSSSKAMSRRLGSLAMRSERDG